MVQQKATLLNTKHSLSAVLLGRKVLREKPVPGTAPGGKRNPSATPHATSSTSEADMERLLLLPAERCQ